MMFRWFSMVVRRCSMISMITPMTTNDVSMIFSDWPMKLKDFQGSSKKEQQGTPRWPRGIPREVKGGRKTNICKIAFREEPNYVSHWSVRVVIVVPPDPNTQAGILRFPQFLDKSLITNLLMIGVINNNSFYERLLCFLLCNLLGVVITRPA